jgi:glycerophosphoryl diester phosphodiesterase
VAHRGGSASWPEHTQTAYTQSVWAGAHVLEISCGRTSDGVWFGCHDRSLERLGGPATPVAQMTWAEVEQAMAGTDYMPARLDWLIERNG